MASSTELRFVPSASEGLTGVEEVILQPDRMTLRYGGKSRTVRFLWIARWYSWSWLYFLRVCCGLGVQGWPAVGERDWFHPPTQRFIRFYTSPPITLFMPEEPPETPYSQTTFRRIQDVLAEGGFSTLDLG